jgi:pre-mRNA-splicing factor 38A
MAMYARNVFCYNSNWKRLKRSFDFNYNYVRENNTSYKLTDIEKKIRKYCNKFIEYNQNMIIYMDEFIDKLLRAERFCDINLPRITKRYVLENNQEIEPY